MRLVTKLTLAVALTAGFAMSADAQGQRQGRGQGQPPGGGMGMGRGMMSAYSMVSTNKVLQEELKLDEAAVTKVKDAVKPIADKQREAMQGVNFREMTDEQRKEFGEKTAKFAEETKKAVEGALSADQNKRLKQVNYQVMGLAAFADKEVVAALKVTDEQKDKVKAISDELTKDRRELMQGAFGGGRPDPEKMAEMTKKSAALAKEAEEKVMGLMSDDQKKGYKELIGEKFDTAKLMQGFGRPMRKDD